MKFYVFLGIACVVLQQASSIGGSSVGGWGGGGWDDDDHPHGCRGEICAVTVKRVIILSDNMSDCNPTRLCVGRCFSYPVSFWPNVQSLGLTKNDYVIVVPGPTTSPNTASIIAGIAQIVSVAASANLYGVTSPVPSPDTSGVAGSNTAIKTLASIAAAANWWDWAVDYATFEKRSCGGFQNDDAEASFCRFCRYANQKLGLTSTLNH